MSVITFHGNLTKDPEMQYTPAGMAKTKFTVAENIGWGEKKTTVFYIVNIAGKSAETANERLHKGSHVFVSGNLEPWEKDGKTFFIVNNGSFQFLDKASGDSKPAAAPIPEDELPF